MGQIIKDAITGRKKTVIQGDKVYDAITGRQIGFFKDGYYVSFSTGRNQSWVTVSGPDLSGVTADPEDVAADKYFINANGELLSGSLSDSVVDVQENLVVIEPGIVRNRVAVAVQGAGAPDLSGVTVTADTLLSGVVACDKDGNYITGTIPDVTPSLDGNTFTVSQGFIRTPQTLKVAEMAAPQLDGNTVTVGIGYNSAVRTISVPLAGDLTVADNIVTVPVGYIDEVRTAVVALAAEPVVSDNKVTIKKGYVPEQKDITIDEALEPTVDGNVVTVYKGYVKSQKTVAIPEMTVQNDGEKVIIPVGYNKTELQISIKSGGIDTSDATATAAQMLYPATAYVNGVKITGNIPTVTATLSGNVATVPAGYIASKQTLTVPTVTATMNANTVTVPVGYIAEKQTLSVPEAGGLTVTDNVVTVPIGYIKTQRTATVPAAAAPTTSGNVVTVNKGYQAAQKKITVGTSVAAKTYTPGTTDQTIAAGSYLAGKQTIKGDANLIAENIADGKSIFGVAGTLKASSGKSMDFYRCESYDNGETIPAYANIQISGLTSPATANGLYLLQDVEATGTDRVWLSDAGYKIANKNGTWYIYDGATEPNNMTALFYKEVLPSTTGDGSAENPVYWDNALASANDRTLSESYLTSDYSSSGNKRNFYVKLKAGTQYKFGVSDGGIDADILLYDLSGNLLQQGDENNNTINGVDYQDSVTYTPSATGIYRISAGAYSSGSGTVQVACYPAPEVAEAPTSTEPWEIAWNIGGAEEGAYIITNAAPEFIGVYTPSSETLDKDTVWTNTTTGVYFKAYTSGSSWQWMGHKKSTTGGSDPWVYAGQNRTFPTPWDVTDTWSMSGTSIQPTFARGTGQATGTLTLARQDIAERPATGVKVWAGYKATQDTETLEWSFADSITSNLQVKGAIPIVGRIYSADTTVQVASLTEDTPGQMVCLAHFDGFAHNTAPSFVDGTDTCIISIMSQASISTERAKFGNGSWWGNYRAVAWNGGFNVIGLPAIPGDFTVEFWHYYSNYTDFGGLILYVYYDQEEVASLNAVKLAETHPQYIENEWFHHAFVRQGSTVTEYINGVKVATHEFTATLGGNYGLAVYGGGWSQSDVRNNIDEFAIWNYARYVKNFTPPFVAYEDKPSGLRTPDTAVGEVTVSGIKSISWANSKSYTLDDDDYNPEYPISRCWVTVDGKWYIFFNDMDGRWVIANSQYYDDDGFVVAAYIASNEDQYYIDPIGNSDWVDAATKTKVKVTAN